MKVGRIIAAAVLGLLFLLFIAADLVLFGVVPLNSVVVTILPAAGLVIGGVLGGFAGRRGMPPADPIDQLMPPLEPPPPPPPPPPAPPEPFAPPTAPVS